MTSANIENIKIQHTGRNIKKEKEFVEISGLQPETMYNVFTTTLKNAVTALAERLFYVKNSKGQFIRPPAPRANHFNNQLDCERQKITTYFSQCGWQPVKLTDEQYILTSAPHKRKLARQTVLFADGRAPKVNDSFITMFIKAEKTESLTKANPVPRLVSPRTPIYCMALAKFLRPAEHVIYAAVNGMWGSETIMKGYNAEEIGNIVSNKWRKYNNPAAIDLDANRFDQHVSTQALRWEHNIYKNMYEGQDRTELSRLLGMQLKNQIICRTSDGYTLKCVSKGGRMSGDINTALGNCLLMSSIIHAFKRRHHINCDLLNNGDDCVIICEKEDVKYIEQHIGAFCLDFGFSLKVGEIVSTMEHISFCQTNPVWRGDQYVMVRNPRTALAKDCIMLVAPTGQSHFDRWRSTVGIGGRRLTDGLPVFPNFYKCIARGSRKYRENKLIGNIYDTGFWRLGERMVTQERPVTNETRLSFWTAFGISPDIQRVLEKQYDEMDIAPLQRAEGIQYLAFPQLYKDHTNESKTTESK